MARSATGWLLFLSLQLVRVARTVPLDLQAACPRNITKLTMELILSGTKPYVLGGRSQERCQYCEDQPYWSDFCSWNPKARYDVCDEQKQKQLLQRYLDQGGLWEDYLTLSPCQLWPFLEGRTLFLLGDSQTLKLMDALSCMLIEMWDPQVQQWQPPSDDEELVAELTDPSGNKAPPMCVTLLRGSRLCYLRATKVAFLEESLLPALPRIARADDLVVMNAGIWHNAEYFYKTEMELLAKWLARNKPCLPFLLWMDSPMQHFNTPLGGYEQQVDPDNPGQCVPLRDVAFDPVTHHLVSDNPEHPNLHGGWRNQVARAYMRDLGIPVVETWNRTYDLHAYHDKNPFVAKTDCSHFCNPSAQQVWMWELYQVLQQQSVPLAQHISDTSSGRSWPRDDVQQCRQMAEEWVPASQQDEELSGVDQERKLHNHHHRHHHKRRHWRLLMQQRLQQQQQDMSAQQQRELDGLIDPLRVAGSL